ncbi:MAG: ASKHA domain-containing protein [Thermodesulfobacteriota bacterium]
MSDLQKTKCLVTFQPGDRTLEVAPGSSVIKAARDAGIHINASCGGSGVCGKCRVIVVEGELSGGTSEKLSADDLAKGFRQACTAEIINDCVIKVPDSSGKIRGGLGTAVPERHKAKLHKYDIEELRSEGIFLPPVEKLFLELPRPSLVDNMADAKRVIQGLHNQYDEKAMVISLSVLRKLRHVLREDDFRITVTLARPVQAKRGKNFLVNIQAGNWIHRNFGLVFDIGTTTIYGQLIDLNNGKILVASGDYNAQISYGEDVINRIIFAETDEGLQKMSKLVIETINTIISSLLAEADVNSDEITSITLAGNTTMTHLALSIEPHSIRRSPYVPVSTFFPPMRASDLGLNLPPHTVALFFPAISSYVGGDIVAGVMGSGLYRTEALTLYVDIGTNAEIVIGNKEWLVCAACSAGPAFEGGGITHGMRAADGAIKDFDIDPESFEPMNLTINNKPAVGICGSGLLVIIASLLEAGVIDRSGKFNRQLETSRIREGRSGSEYVLALEEENGTDHDIVLNEVDIENFIRAKAAIYAGIKTLVEEVGLQMSDLEQVILAGAFGSFIDLDAAMTVGLLPELPPEKMMYVGNGSLMGGRMSELSNHIRKDVVEVVGKMTSFELSEVNSFKDQYMASMFLPHTDLTLFPSTAARLAAATDNRD